MFMTHLAYYDKINSKIDKMVLFIHPAVLLNIFNGLLAMAFGKG